MSNEPKLISEKEAAKLLAMSPGSLRVLRCRKGKMRSTPGAMDLPPYIKLGREVKYDMRDLEAYVEKHKVRPVACL